jgi:hypothetical protein
VHTDPRRRDHEKYGRDIRHPYIMDSLSTLFRRSLLNVSKASNLPTIQDETQVISHWNNNIYIFVQSIRLGFNRRGTEGLPRIARTRRTSCALQSQRDPRRHLYSRSGIFICSIRPRRDRKQGPHNGEGRSPGTPARSRGLSVSRMRKTSHSRVVVGSKATQNSCRT